MAGTRPYFQSASEMPCSLRIYKATLHLKPDLIPSTCCNATVEAQRWGSGGLGGIPCLGRDSLLVLCNAEPRGARVCRVLAGTPHATCWDTARGTGTHPRTAQGTAAWVHAAYSTDTCLIWSMRFVTFGGQGHTCNVPASGAVVQRNINLGCSGHSWHTIHMHPVSQANWGLQRRLSVTFTFCMHSFPPCTKLPCTQRFRKGRLPHALLLPCTVLLAMKTRYHPPSLQRTRFTQFQPFTFSFSQP